MKIADKIFNFHVKSSKLVAALKAESGYIPLAEASILSDGYFEIILPDIVLGYSYLSSPKVRCEEINVYPESLKVAVVDALWLFDSNETVIGHVFQGSTQASITGALGETVVSRWYANHNGHINATARCGAHGMAVDFKLNLKKGWNDVVRHFHADSEESIHTSKDINGMHWFMTLNRLPHQRPQFP